MEDLAVQLVIQLVVGLVFGAICSSIASGRGRSAVGWFFVGLVAPCLGLILVLVLPDLKAQEERQKRLTKENRRLKEALRKDRQVSDRRFSETERRLSVHDRALDIDTGGNLQAGETAPLLGGHAGAPDTEDRGVKEWYYLVGDQQVGPVSFSSLGALWRDGVVDGSTLVWKSSMDDWKTISDLPEIEERLHG